MLKCILIYLWIYTAVFGAIEAGDANEHVHIKLHMPKSSIRKSVRHHHHHHHSPPLHVRHKKNPPPYASPHPSMPPSPSGPAATHTHIYHETAHNYLTAGTQPSGPHFMLDHHHMQRLPTTAASSSSVTQLHPTGLQQQQQLMEADIYTTPLDGGPPTAIGEGDEAEALSIDGGDYMSYLSANFAAFPKPTTLESEIISTPASNAELAYQQQHHHHPVSVRSVEGQRNHHPLNYFQRHPYDAAAASVVATNHELDEDNEILGALGRTTTLMEPNGWTSSQHHAKPHRGLSSSSTRALKNEHLLKQILQQQHEHDDEEQQYPYPAYQTEIANTPAYSTSSSTSSPSALLRSRNKQRDDKLHRALATANGGYGSGDNDMQHTYEDMDLATAYSEGGDSQRGAGSNDERGIKALTVDDIWSQLQRTYLSKYTPQAQPAAGVDDETKAEAMGQRSSRPSAKKQKRNSLNPKTKKRHYHTRTVAPTTATAVRSGNYESNYYNQEHDDGKPSTFYDHHTPQSSSYGSSFAAPFSQFAPAASSLSDRDLFATRASTRPYNAFKTLSHFDANPTTTTTASEEDNNEDDDSLQAYIANSGTGHDDDDTSSGVDDIQTDDDVSSEESLFGRATHKKSSGSNHRGHRHSHGNVAYGHANLNNNFFNYQDLYASYSTPIAVATIATHTNGQQPSTYHPNSYGATAQTAGATEAASPNNALATTSYQQKIPSIIAPAGQHESTSYQWREQQHYPASSYQSYHTSGLHRPQTQQLQQQQLQHPTPSLYQTPTSSALRLPQATVASTAASLSQHALFSPSPSSSLSSSSLSILSPSSSSLGLSTNDFTSAVKQTNGQQQSQQQQQRYKKRKNRTKSKRNRIVVV